jgi:hypothetical protein
MVKKAPNTASPLAPAKLEPFDWDAYYKRVDESITAAEHHLEISVGTISSIATEPDFIATVKAYAVVEPFLNDLIATWPPKTLAFGVLPMPLPSQSDNFRSFVTALPISGNSGKLKLAEGLGLLSDWQISFVLALARIRNRYAHNVKNMHRSLGEMLAEEQEHNARIVKHLTGLGLKLPLPAGWPDRMLRLFMYHRLADFLAQALHILRPPPAPEGGILRAFFEKEAKNKSVSQEQ